MQADKLYRRRIDLTNYYYQHQPALEPTVNAGELMILALYYLMLTSSLNNKLNIHNFIKYLEIRKLLENQHVHGMAAHGMAACFGVSSHDRGTVIIQ